MAAPWRDCARFGATAPGVLYYVRHTNADMPDCRRLLVWYPQPRAGRTCAAHYSSRYPCRAKRRGAVDCRCMGRPWPKGCVTPLWVLHIRAGTPAKCPKRLKCAPQSPISADGFAVSLSAVFTNTSPESRLSALLKTRDAVIHHPPGRHSHI